MYSGNLRILGHSIMAAILVMATYGSTMAMSKDLRYLGKLTEGGNPAAGVHNMTFRFYGARDGDGELLWSSGKRPVSSEQNGQFEVWLSPFEDPLVSSVFLDADQWWLEIEVDGERLEVRQRVPAQPLAAIALEADRAWNAETVQGMTPADLLGAFSAGPGLTIDEAHVITLTADLESIFVCDVDGFRPSWDSARTQWTCDIDRMLSEDEVDAFVANNGYASSSELNDGDPETTPVNWNDLTDRPAGLHDGDDDTLGDHKKPWGHP